MFSATVMCGQSAQFWNTVEMSRALGGRSFTRAPSMRMVPPEMSSSPAIMRRSVLLPQPDGPGGQRPLVHQEDHGAVREGGVGGRHGDAARGGGDAVALHGHGHSDGTLQLHGERGLGQHLFGLVAHPHNPEAPARSTRAA